MLRVCRCRRQGLKIVWKFSCKTSEFDSSFECLITFKTTLPTRDGVLPVFAWLRPWKVKSTSRASQLFAQFPSRALSLTRLNHRSSNDEVLWTTPSTVSEEKRYGEETRFIGQSFDTEIFRTSCDFASLFRKAKAQQREKTVLQSSVYERT